MAYMAGKTLSASDIAHIAKLAQLPITEEQAEELRKQVGTTVNYVSQIQSLETGDSEETSQVTGLENVFREDVVETQRSFTQEQALANAKRTHNGFFVVDAVFGE